MEFSIDELSMLLHLKKILNIFKQLAGKTSSD